MGPHFVAAQQRLEEGTLLRSVLLSLGIVLPAHCKISAASPSAKHVRHPGLVLNPPLLQPAAEAVVVLRRSRRCLTTIPACFTASASCSTRQDSQTHCGSSSPMRCGQIQCSGTRRL